MEKKIKPIPEDHAWKLLVLLLHTIALKQGITIEQIADDTGFNKPTIERLFALKFCPKMDMFTKIAKSVGVILLLEGSQDLDIEGMMDQAMNKLGIKPKD